ncbi:hypothetical protein QJS10_CPA03g00371 [Acorus calamus]|uniref:Reverse transcriptase zinc-binding domain-containing protein n=1 Tax=Acorus calamus TaxID=4465 RepID=A0AAV9F5P5_ACOCL|nr:hypothetical protein QJS10_CPA03g00371 [Acorus calamus]
MRIVTWNPGINTTCALCSVEEESAEHLFVRCAVARRVWGWLEEAYGMNASFSTAEKLWATDMRRPVNSNAQVKSMKDASPLRGIQQEPSTSGRCCSSNHGSRVGRRSWQKET